MIIDAIHKLSLNYVDWATIDAIQAANGLWRWRVRIGTDNDEVTDDWEGPDVNSGPYEAAANGLSFIVDRYADPELSEVPVESYQLAHLNPLIDVHSVALEGGRWGFRVDCLEDNFGGRYVGQALSIETYASRGDALGAGVLAGRWFRDRDVQPVPANALLHQEQRPRRNDEEPLLG